MNCIKTDAPIWTKINRKIECLKCERDYLINKLDSIVPLQRLDSHSSGIDQLGQVYGLGRVDSPQINQVLQSFQRQRLVLRTAAG